MLACSAAHLHEAGDTQDGLVRLIEHLPPGEGAVRPLGVLGLLGQESGDVGHGPAGVTQLSVEDAGSDVVLQQSLECQSRKRFYFSCSRKSQTTGLSGQNVLIDRWLIKH